MYTCKYFAIYELVPRSLYEAKGEKAWTLLDSRALEMLDKIREYAGPMVVNTWYWGGDRSWSGLRLPGKPYYSPFSQHTYGRAFDCIASQMATEELREYILSNPEEFPYIRGIELDVSWLHFDVGNRPGEGIVTFNP